MNILKINNVLVNGYNLRAKVQQNSNKLVAVNVEYTPKKILENIEEVLLRHDISDTSSKIFKQFPQFKM